MRVDVYLCVTRLHSATHTSGTDHKFGICLRACNINNNVAAVVVAVIVVVVVVAVEAAVSRYTKQENTQYTVCFFGLSFAFHCERLDVLGEKSV